MTTAAILGFLIWLGDRKLKRQPPARTGAERRLALAERERRRAEREKKEYPPLRVVHSPREAR